MHYPNSQGEVLLCCDKCRPAPRQLMWRTHTDVIDGWPIGKRSKKVTVHKPVKMTLKQRTEAAPIYQCLDCGAKRYWGGIPKKEVAKRKRKRPDKSRLRATDTTGNH